MTRRLMHLLAALPLLVLVGCSGTADPEVDAPPTRASGAPSSGAPGSEAPTVTPLPPARYRSSVPDRTVRTPGGYLVNRCVPPSLRRHATTLTTSDGVHLSTLVLGSGTKGVLLSHEQGYYICSFLGLARRLAADGYLVVLPEYRNHGASEGTPDNEHIERDTEAALAELERQGAERVFLGGASCGGTASAVVGARDGVRERLVGLLNMSSPAWCGGLNSPRAVKRITAPSLFVVSPGDMDGAVEEQVRVVHKASAAADKELVIDPSGFHGTDMLGAPGTGPALEQRVLAFIEGTFTD
ncbi:alpha/beta hydrolase [Pimelobacter simplex]|uniref:Uncharacterized protein n=1 Tax=Nocardioides simplex TaxID=2045 RepID=A0A0A1DQB5_NOCSI|nr:hypothetical protein [Pimelobacter simplex]AIY19606.2 hypothetical protein KR76_00165 [Pimelobacter simplex]GEB15188.1 hypothetical protein NSI01_35030 [Pimelobacter simplex]